MQCCPLCAKPFSGDIPAFEYHVNHCLDSAADLVASASKTPNAKDASDYCPCCFSSWQDLDVPEYERESHVQACLTYGNDSQDARQSAQINDDTCPVCARHFKATEDKFLHVERCLGNRMEEQANIGWEQVDEPDDGQHSQPYEGSWVDLFKNQDTRGTKANAPVVGQKDLFPILTALLEKSHANTNQGASTVLCSAHTIHVDVRMLDYGFGFACGYFVGRLEY